MVVLVGKPHVICAKTKKEDDNFHSLQTENQKGLDCFNGPDETQEQHQFICAWVL